MSPDKIHTLKYVFLLLLLFFPSESCPKCLTSCVSLLLIFKELPHVSASQLEEAYSLLLMRSTRWDVKARPWSPVLAIPIACHCCCSVRRRQVQNIAWVLFCFVFPILNQYLWIIIRGLFFFFFWFSCFSLTSWTWELRKWLSLMGLEGLPVSPRTKKYRVMWLGSAGCLVPRVVRIGCYHLSTELCLNFQFLWLFEESLKKPIIRCT